jgi:acetate kinase
LTGLNMGIRELFKLYGKEKKVTLAFDVYKNHILKYIGECISVLEGVDVIIIGGNFVPFLKPFIYSLLKHISFLGISLADLPWKNESDITEISSDGSDVKIYINNLHSADIIYKETEKINSKNGINLIPDLV